MPSIPVDVLREILEYVDIDDLAILCIVNKIFCSCSQDVLYREIEDGDAHVVQKSTDIARRVRSFATKHSSPELATALRNMSSLRSLELDGVRDESILDGCTFELDSFETSFPYFESLQNFLNSQPSLTELSISRCLPNLTRVKAFPSLLRILIPGRPVRVVIILSPWRIDSTDLSFFTLSTTSLL